MHYRIDPGLYGIGQPDSDSPVFVTANYKMSFDALRSELDGIAGWILVLDTKGINVWCAAGKGIFSTETLVRQITETSLDRIVSHRILILPQLGAPGIAAHLVKTATGFTVKYGPVRARHLKYYLPNNLEATKDMRTVTFRLNERLALIPVEFVKALFLLPLISIALVLIALIRGQDFTVRILQDLSLFMAAILAGTIAVPILLPWIPFRSFALKGWLLGLLVALSGSFVYGMDRADWVSNLLLLPPLSAFLALNFTGSTNFTSLSGVQKEILYAIPAIVVSVVSGIVIKLVL
jgi:hypothetical protein